MKRLLVLCVIGLMIIPCCSCKGGKKDFNSSRGELSVEDTKQGQNAEDSSDSNVNVIYPEESRIRYVCNLATLECSYHNLAVGHVSPGAGPVHWTEEETEFWVEYEARATLGVDASEISIDCRGNDVVVTMPHATVIGIVEIDPNSVGDPVSRPNGFFRNDVEISASDVSDAMANANQVVRDNLLNDQELIMAAELQAENIIRNYINSIGNLSGNQFNITFQYRS